MRIEMLNEVLHLTQGDIKNTLTRHPLKNPESKHYELWEGCESIEVLEATLSIDELIGWCKGNILKYRLRIGHKDDPLKEIKKIMTYENYLAYLFQKKGFINEL